MKRFDWCVPIVLILLMVVQVYGDDPVSEATEVAPGLIAVRGSCDIPPGVMLDVVAHLQENLGVHVHQDACVSARGSSPRDVLLATQARLSKDTGLAMTLYTGGTNASSTIHVAGRVAALDLTTLLPPGDSLNPTNKVVQYRVQRESIRAIGHLLGMQECPNPHCSLFRHDSFPQLDRKGRNLCPPCRMKSITKFAEVGITAVPPWETVVPQSAEPEACSTPTNARE